jgi:uncharacterized protein YecE (DUF72 family)
VAQAQGKLHSGTSGYSYPSWKPGFYPKNVPSSKFLEYYATRLNLVEVNYTFRQLGKESTFDKWIASTPDDFVFSPKAHNKITHILKLKNAEEFTRAFLTSLDPFRASGKLGPVLFQLPPSLKVDAPRLKEFIAALPRGYRFAFEFRHDSWYSEEVYTALRDRNAALCLAESEERESPEIVTADFVYYRFRKPEYQQPEFDRLTERVSRHRLSGLPVYALFKHEETPAGAVYAERLLQASEK